MSKGDELAVVCSSWGRKACVSARGGRLGPPGSQLLPICEWVWVTALIFLRAWAAWLCQGSHSLAASSHGEAHVPPETVETSHRSWPWWAFHTYPNYVFLLLPCPSTTKPASSNQPLRSGAHVWVENRHRRATCKQRWAKNWNRTPGAGWAKERRRSRPWEHRYSELNPHN